MLVAISGAQGSGKSTILAELEARGYPVVQRKTSRSILSDWSKTLDEINDDPLLSMKFQDEILARKIADEQAAVEHDHLHFTERTYMDLFVYTLVNLGKFNAYSSWLDEYYEQCVEAQRSYSKIFYLRSGMFNVVDDGVRGSNGHYSNMVDLLLLHYTQRSVNHSRVGIISTPDISERVNQILVELA